MNMQALMKQAQAMQKDMMKAQEEIENAVFVGESSLVRVEMIGNHNIKSIKIDAPDGLDGDEMELLEDMILVATNSAIEQINKTTQDKMGKFGNMPGMF